MRLHHGRTHHPSRRPAKLPRVLRRIALSVATTLLVIGCPLPEPTAPKLSGSSVDGGAEDPDYPAALADAATADAGIEDGGNADADAGGGDGGATAVCAPSGPRLILSAPLTRRSLLGFDAPELVEVDGGYLLIRLTTSPDRFTAYRLDRDGTLTTTGRQSWSLAINAFGEDPDVARLGELVVVAVSHRLADGGREAVRIDLPPWLEPTQPDGGMGVTVLATGTDLWSYDLFANGDETKVVHLLHPMVMRGGLQLVTDSQGSVSVPARNWLADGGSGDYWIRGAAGPDGGFRFVQTPYPDIVLRRTDEVLSTTAPDRVLTPPVCQFADGFIREIATEEPAILLSGGLTGCRAIWRYPYGVNDVHRWFVDDPIDAGLFHTDTTYVNGANPMMIARLIQYRWDGGSFGSTDLDESGPYKIVAVPTDGGRLVLHEGTHIGSARPSIARANPGGYLISFAMDAGEGPGFYTQVFCTP